MIILKFRQRVHGVFVCVIVVFQFIFLVTIICGSDIISVPPNYLKPISYEYWTWLVETRELYDSSLIDVAIVVKMFVTPFLLLGLCYEVPGNLIQSQDKRRLIFSLLFGLIGYGIYFIYVRFFSVHYYLPMMLIPTELLSISLFCVLYHSESS